jgi:Ca-activated chloride channel family protein
MRLDIIPERPCIPVGEVASLPILLRLTAPTVPQMVRKPLNLCLVIDRSGSMAGKKLRQTIASVKFVVERLAASDILSVVQFDERVKVVIPPGPVTDKAHLCRRLDAIDGGGQTNLSGGWLRGAACVREAKSPEYVNRVILLTDGQANHGIVDPAVLVTHAAELTEEGITTTTLGYGEDFNEDLLTALADAGRGNTYHVETADQAPTIFAKELEGLLTIAAQNVWVTFTPSSLVRRVDPCSAMEHQQAGKTLTVSLGDLVSEDARSILVSFRVAPTTQDGWVSLGSITVAYDDVVGGIRTKALTHEVLIGALSPEKVAAIPPDAAVGKELLMLRAAKVLQAAIAQADAGDLKEATQRLTAFLGAPEVAAATGPEIQAARRRIKDLLHDLADRGFDKVSRTWRAQRCHTILTAGTAMTVYVSAKFQTGDKPPFYPATPVVDRGRLHLTLLTEFHISALGRKSPAVRDYWQQTISRSSFDVPGLGTHRLTPEGWFHYESSMEGTVAEITAIMADAGAGVVRVLRPYL